MQEFNNTGAKTAGRRDSWMNRDIENDLETMNAKINKEDAEIEENFSKDKIKRNQDRILFSIEKRDLLGGVKARYLEVEKQSIAPGGLKI
jgi:hypothetical protein